MAKGSFTNFTEDVENHQSQPQKPTLSWQNLQVLFDKAVVDIKAWLNTTLLGELNADGGSNKIGHDSTNITSDNVQEALEEVRAIAVDAQAGSIVDGSITDAKLNVDVKIGSLGNLDTTEKSSVVLAMNELHTTADDASSNAYDALVNSNEALGRQKFPIATGSANSIAVDSFGTFDLTDDTSSLFFTPIANNTGAVTIAVDSQTSKAIKKYEDGAYTALEADDLKAYQQVILRWDLANDFFVLAPKSSGAVIENIEYITVSLGAVNGTFTPTIVTDYTKAVTKIVGVSRRTNDSADDGNRHLFTATLESNTSGSLERNVTANALVDVTIAIIQYKNVKSVQKREYYWASSSSGGTTLTIDEVDLSKSELILQYRNSASNTVGYTKPMRAYFSSSTSVVVTNYYIEALTTAYIQVVEYN